MLYSRPNVCFKRFNAEIGELFEKKSCEELQVTYKKDEIVVLCRATPAALPTNELMSTPSTNHHSIQITLIPEYPFRPPKITVNNDTYFNFMKSDSPRINTLLFRNFVDKCLTKITITNSENWKPTFCIMQIIDEIRLINNIKIIIKYLMCLDEICRIHKISEDVERIILEYILGDNNIIVENGVLDNHIFAKCKGRRVNI